MGRKSKHPPEEKAPLVYIIMFFLSLSFLLLFGGWLMKKHEVFLHPLFEECEQNITELKIHLLGLRSDMYEKTTRTEAERVTVLKKDKVQPGLNKMVMLDAGDHAAIKIMRLDGEILHTLNANWFDIWPYAPHLSLEEAPRSMPGTFVHGAAVLDDASIVYNYEDLGMVRVDICGNVVWRLPYRTHHSVWLDDEGSIWSPGLYRHEKKLEKYPNYIPVFVEPTIVKISQDGKVLMDKSLFEIFEQNGIPGFLYLTSSDLVTTEVTSDTLHVNDVEVFSGRMQEGFFKKGDIMVSIRNANATMVFEPETWKLKYLSHNTVVRQHDPDFVDGDTISIFDNNMQYPEDEDGSSRIVVEDVPSGKQTVLYEGSEDHFFYTHTLGKHQWLENGNVLIVESRHGRVFEITQDGETVWEYHNVIEPGWLGALSGVERLPAHMDEAFFEKAKQKCGG